MKRSPSTICIGTTLFLHLIWILSAISLRWPISNAEAYDGHPLWKGDVAISTDEGPQGIPRLTSPGLDMISDGSGGAFIAWKDNYWGNVMIQRINNDGQSLWQPNGVPIAPGEWYQMTPRMVPDGAGGIIVAWVDGRNGWCGPSFFAGCEIYAQRIDSSGTRMWEEGGVAICTDPDNQGMTGIAITSDGIGGAIMAWEDSRGRICCKLFAQRINPNGQVMWTPDGIRVTPEPTHMVGSSITPHIVADGTGGMIVVWVNDQIEPAQISAQRISSNGQLLWQPNGIQIGTPGYLLFDTVSDRVGGALVSFQSYDPNGYGIKVQHITADGQILWSPGGFLVTFGKYLSTNPRAISDGAGGAIVAWEDGRNMDPFESGGCGSVFGNCDVYAQRIDAGGQALWGNGGIPICTAPRNQGSPHLVPDGLGGAIISWEDCRKFDDPNSCLFNMDLYAQRVTATGETLWRADGTPVSIASGGQGVDYDYVMTSDGENGAILVWPDTRNYESEDFDVFTQRISDHSPGPVAELSLSMIGSPDSITAANTCTYTITIINHGPDEATGISLFGEFDIPVEQAVTSQGDCFLRSYSNTLTCDLGSLPNGSTAEVKIPILYSYAGTYSGKAMLWAFESDSDLTDNTSSVTTIVLPFKPLTIEASSLPEGEVDADYTASLQISGGIRPYNVKVIEGVLPSGLSLDTNGNIKGIPSQPGTKRFTVQVIDQLGVSATKKFNLKLLSALSITTKILKKGTVGKNYNGTIAASGGKQPFTWSLVSGNLPGSLGLNSSTGRITGTPTVSANFSLTFQVSDLLGGISRRDFILTVK